MLIKLIKLFSPDVDGTASASETNCGGGGGLWDNCGATLGQLWDDSVTIVGQLWDDSVSTL